MFYDKIKYYERVFAAYVLKKQSHLTFWHGNCQINPDANYKQLGEFYQLFEYKAKFNGDFDENGVILLNYHGKTGKRKYHIAIAQYALACYNQYKKTNDKYWYNRFFNQVKWLKDNLKQNDKSIYLWYADFEWEYHGILSPPWASGLAQGNGLSVILRAYKETNNKNYLDIAHKIFKSMITEINNGGVMLKEHNNYWIEEILNPPNHILNGFMWAIMGIYDYMILTKDKTAEEFFNKFIITLENNIHKFDTGFWSLYELSNTKMPMLASYFYHSLHIVQLEILYNMTNNKIFRDYKNKWELYKHSFICKNRALFHKILFKFIYF